MFLLCILFIILVLLFLLMLWLWWLSSLTTFVLSCLCCFVMVACGWAWGPLNCLNFELWTVVWIGFCWLCCSTSTFLLKFRHHEDQKTDGNSVVERVASRCAKRSLLGEVYAKGGLLEPSRHIMALVAWDALRIGLLGLGMEDFQLTCGILNYRAQGLVLWGSRGLGKKCWEQNRYEGSWPVNLSYFSK